MAMLSEPSLSAGLLAMVTAGRGDVPRLICADAASGAGRDTSDAVVTSKNEVRPW